MKNAFAKRLSDYREFVGETQQELADAIQVKIRTLRSWEQGVHCCSFDDLIAICQHYQISSDWLLGLVQNDSPIAARTQRDRLSIAERQTLTLFEDYLLSRHK